MQKRRKGRQGEGKQSIGHEEERKGGGRQYVDRKERISLQRERKEEDSKQEERKESACRQVEEERHTPGGQPWQGGGKGSSQAGRQNKMRVLVVCWSVLGSLPRLILLLLLFLLLPQPLLPGNNTGTSSTETTYWGVVVQIS